MSKKMCFVSRGMLVGREYSPAKAASEFDGKKFDAKPESFTAYFLFGNGAENNFFVTQPNVVAVKLVKASYDKADKIGAYECSVELEYERFKILAIKGLDVESGI